METNENASKENQKKLLDMGAFIGEKMIGLSSRIAALEVLDQTLDKKCQLDLAFQRSEKLRFLNLKDRSLARNIVMTTLRRLGQIDDLIFKCLKRKKRVQPRCKNILRIGICQLLFFRTADHAAISTTLNLADHFGLGTQKSFINGILRRLQREGKTLMLSQDVANLNTPDWLWRSWVSAYGEKKTRDIALMNLSQPPLDLSLRKTSKRLIEKLNGTVLPWKTLRCRTAGEVEQLAGYEEGLWWVQDSASRIAVGLLGKVKGKKVIDLCAAPGGKTLHLLNRGATVISLDRSETRLRRLQENLARVNLKSQIIVEDCLKWRPNELADFVLLDAPCSATGTIRRNPDVAYLKTKKDVLRLASLQAKLIDSASKMVRSSGTMLYCTCSLQPEEGPDQVRDFLARNSEFYLDKIQGGEIFEKTNPSGVFRSLPCDMHKLGGRDGFFAARFKRL